MVNSKVRGDKFINSIHTTVKHKIVFCKGNTLGIYSICVVYSFAVEVCFSSINY